MWQLFAKEKEAIKSLNKYHRQVAEWLSELGVQYVEEYPVEKFSIDLYLPELNLGVELDGMYHRPKHDQARDELIRLFSGIPIIRIKVGTPKQKCLETIFGDNYALLDSKT